MSDAENDVTIEDVPDEDRFVLRVGDQVVGFVQYRLRGSLLALLHTEIGDEFEGHGYGGTLVRGVLDQARERGLDVLPYCPFVNEYIARHPEYVDLVPEPQRSHFGL